MRLIVVSDHSLVSEAVRMALTSRGFEAVSLAAPLGRGGHRDFAQRVVRFGPAVGLLLCELEDRPCSVMPWRSWLGADPLGAADPVARLGRVGSLVDAGVAAVLPMTTNLDSLADALSRVAAGRR